MPCWWPNHLIDWTQIKNLSHKYEGYLGNTYSNCLRIAVIRGYAHYGLDANEYVEKGNNGTTSNNGNTFNLCKSQGNYTSLMDRKKNQSSAHRSEEEIVIEPAFYGNEDSSDSCVVQSDDDGVIRIDGTPVTAPVSVENSSGGFQPLTGLEPRLPTEPLPPAVANCRQMAATASRPMGMVKSSKSSLPSAPATKVTSEILKSSTKAKSVSRGSASSLAIATTFVNIKGSHMKSIVESDDPKQTNYPTKLLSRKTWFPPKLNCERAICKPGVATSLKGCKVVLERMDTLSSDSDSLCFTNLSYKTSQDSEKPICVQKFIYDDMLTHHKFTDFFVQAGIGKKERIPVHRIMLITHSPKLKTLIEEVNTETDSGLVFGGVDYGTLKQIVDAIYLGQVVVTGKISLKRFEDVLASVKSFGILCDLKRKPRTFPAWKISDANLTFADVSSSTNDPSDDDLIENDEDDEDFVLEDAHLLDYDSDDEEIHEPNQSHVNSEDRTTITESYINEVRRQVFSKCAKTVPDQDAEKTELELDDANKSNEEIATTNLHISDESIIKRFSSRASKLKKGSSLQQGASSAKNSDHVSNPEVSSSSTRPNSARQSGKQRVEESRLSKVEESRMAGKPSLTEIDDIIPEPCLNGRKTNSDLGELKLAIEDQSINESSIPMIDDRIKTRRGGLRKRELSGDQTVTKESTPDKKRAQNSNLSNSLEFGNEDEDLGRGKRILRRKQHHDDEVLIISSPNTKTIQANSQNTKKGGVTLKTKKEETKLTAPKSPSSKSDQQSRSSQHTYNSRSRRSIHEIEGKECPEESSSRNVSKKSLSSTIIDANRRSKAFSNSSTTQKEGRTRGSLRSQLEDNDNKSKTEMNVLEQNDTKRNTKSRSSSPKKDIPKHQLEKTKENTRELLGKRNTEQWSLVSEPNSTSNETSSRSPRKRIAATELDASPTSSPLSSSATAKRSKLLNTTNQCLARMKEANKPNFEDVSESLLNEKLQEGQIAFVKFLMKLGFLIKEPPLCNKCSSSNTTPMQLVKYAPAESNASQGSNKIQATDGVAWICPGCNHATSVRPGSIFSRCSSSPGLPSSRAVSDSTESLCWIMRLVLCWKDNTSLMSCQQATGADVDKIFLWYNICKEYYGVSGS